MHGRSEAGIADDGTRTAPVGSPASGCDEVLRRIMSCVDRAHPSQLQTKADAVCNSEEEGRAIHILDLCQPVLQPALPVRMSCILADKNGD
jgi:hypothetical protein